MWRPALALVLLVATGARLQGQSPPSAPTAIPLVGDWVLNLGRTHYGPGVDRRRSEHMLCSVEKEDVRCVIHSVRADGRQLTAQFTATVGGVPAPVTGISDIDQVQLRRPSATLVDATFLLRGQPVFGYRAFQSDDGRSLSIVAVDPVTRVVGTTIVVYDRR